MAMSLFENAGLFSRYLARCSESVEPTWANLEEFIEDSLQHLGQRGYVPLDFFEMCRQHGLIAAITRCVEGSEFKSGFLRVLELGLVDWSLETAVVEFPERFTKLTVAYARARLNGVFKAPRTRSAPDIKIAAPISKPPSTIEPNVTFG
jgi:hypothetical protein